MSEDIKQTCGSCKNGCVVEQDLRADLECRRFPPSVTSFIAPTPQGAQIVDRTTYPRVKRLAPSCGEWQPKFQATN